MMLLAAAHGTRSAAGRATIERLVELVRAARPGIRVDLCFLDVLEPRLPDRLTQLDEPAVVVPMLLSAGYHVLEDIPLSAAASAQVVVARHLGPHPLLSQVLADRLAECGAEGDTVALVGSPSKHPDAAADLDAAAADLSRTITRPVHALALHSLPAALAELSGRVVVASYLLAEGFFHDTLRARAGPAVVTEPIGAHPAVARLVLERFDSAAAH